MAARETSTWPRVKHFWWPRALHAQWPPLRTFAWPPSINSAMDIGGNSAVLGGSVSGGQARLWFMPPGGLPFHHSLLVEASYPCGGTTTGFAQAFYTLSA